MSILTKTAVAMLAAAISMAASAQCSAQVIETTEALVMRQEGAPAKDEQLSALCEGAVVQYEAVRTRVEERIEYLENVAVIGDLQSLQDELEGSASIPKECAGEVGNAVDDMIEGVLKEKLADVDREKVMAAQSEMEQTLLPEYRELAQTFEEVCAFCGKKPARLRSDPLYCASQQSEEQERAAKPSRKTCDEAMIRYDNARDALLYRRDLCRQSAKIDGLDEVLFWFQGREDLPLACAVEIKSFIRDLRSHVEGKTSGARYAFAVAHEKCGRALFPIYLRYGTAVKRVCAACVDADARLGRDRVSCY